MRLPCGPQMMATMGQEHLSIHLLGRFSVRRAGEEIPQASFGGRLVRTLVRMLAVQAGTFHSKEVLAENLWGAQQPSKAAANLEVLVSRARRALGDPGVIRTGTGGYSLDPERCSVDAQVFLERVAAGSELTRAGQEAAALRTYLEALEIWQGEPLPEDAYAEWAQGPRRALQRAITTALEAGAAAALSLRDPHQAIQLADRAVAEEPLRESAHLLLIEALAGSGDQAAALAAFDIMRRRFAEELGLDPSDAAWKVQARVLNGVAHSAHALRQARSESIPSTGSLAFVGRQRELEDALGAIENGSPVFLTGPSGAGKSRFLAEVRSRSSVATLSARAFPADRGEAWGLARILLRDALSLDADARTVIPDAAAAALGDLLPDLDLGQGGGYSLDGRSKRALAVEGAVRIVSAAAPSGALLLLDDLQWADPTSLHVVELLLRRMPELRLLAAFRSEEPQESLASFLAAVRASWATNEITLGPLDPTAIEALVDDEATAATISRGTDRFPLTISHVLNEMGRAGAATAGSDGRWRVREVDAAAVAREASRSGQFHATGLRLKRLPPRRRLLLEVLAALGRDSPARLLAIAIGEPESAVLHDLDGLARAGFVRSGEEGWALAHDSIAESALAAMEPGARLALHGRIAKALEEEKAEPSERAFHLAGAGDERAAADTYLAAAQASLARYADDEAGALVSSAMALGPGEGLLAELLQIRAQARARRGRLEEARKDLREAMNHATEGPVRSTILSAMAMLVTGAENLEHASDLAERAIVEAGSDDRALAEALIVASIVDMNIEQPVKAGERADQAIALCRRIGHAEGVARVLDARAMAGFMAGDVTASLTEFDRVATMFADSGELLRVITPRSTRGHALVFAGRPQEGIKDIDEALDLSRTLGHLEGQAYALWQLAEAKTALGHTDEAVEDARQSLAIATSISHRGWTVTALRALGIAYRGAGDLERAEDAFQRSLDMATGFSFFSSWAASQLALTMIERGELARARPLVRRALAEGPPLAGFEARLAEVELAFAEREPGGPAKAVEALAVAEQAGHEASAARLRELVAGAAP